MHKHDNRPKARLCRKCMKYHTPYKPTKAHVWQWDRRECGALSQKNAGHCLTCACPVER